MSFESFTTDSSYFRQIFLGTHFQTFHFTDVTKLIKMSQYSRSSRGSEFYDEEARYEQEEFLPRRSSYGMPRRTAPRPAPKNQGGSSTGMVIALGAGALLLIGAVVAIVICCNNDEEDASKAKSVTCECPGGVAVEGKKCTEASKIMCASCDTTNYFKLDKASKTCKCDDGYVLGADGKCAEKKEPVTPSKQTPSKQEPKVEIVEVMYREPMSQEFRDIIGFNSEAAIRTTYEQIQKFKARLYDFWVQGE